MKIASVWAVMTAYEETLSDRLMTLQHQCCDWCYQVTEDILYKLIKGHKQPTSQGSPHLQSQLQAVPVLSSIYPSLISFSYFTFPGAPYRISLLFLPWLPFFAIFILLSPNNKLYSLHVHVFTCFSSIFIINFLQSSVYKVFRLPQNINDE